MSNSDNEVDARCKVDHATCSTETVKCRCKKEADLDVCSRGGGGQLVDEPVRDGPCLSHLIKHEVQQRLVAVILQEGQLQQSGQLEA